MGKDNTDCDDMPERIWLDPRSYNGAVGFAHPEKHKQDGWAVYIRADLCASGQQVRAVMNALWPILGGNHLEAEMWDKISDGVTAALTPAPQAAGQVMDGWVDDKTFIEPVSAHPPQPNEMVVDADRLLKDALFASIEPTHQSPLYCGVAVTAMTQACAAVFYVPRDWTREQIKDWLGNPQGFTHPPQPSEAVAEALEIANRVFQFNLNSMIVWGDDYNQAVKDAADAVATALRVLKGESDVR